MNFDGLNDMQKKAVKHVDGPLLIIAGAGSGKTRVLTNRIANLIEECGVDPINILAITFTNKAAQEMKERVEKQIDCGNRIWVSTFHSTCVRILRRYIDHIGYDTNFTIYDTDDQKRLIKDVCKRLNIDTKMYKESTLLSAISKAKNKLTTPEQMEAEAGGDYNARRIAEVYKEYQKALKLSNALDFDDLIFKTVELFQYDEAVLNAYQERFKYIMVDEYQDTNSAQFMLVSLLAAKYGNLCVVGDDDQSIYKFRGADISNILDFEKTFKDTKVIKLEQNYRSTKNILNAANSVIGNNKERKEKTLWTSNQEGDKVNFCLYEDGYREAEGVVESISQKVRDGWNYDDIAILYRTNAQSRLLEERLMLRNVPYKIYGGINFYQRSEIKDILAYLKVIDNGSDNQAVKRIINVPKRGIGNTTITRIQEFADYNNISFWDALCMDIPEVSRASSKLESFVTLIKAYKAKAQFLSIQELTEDLLEDIKYYDYLLDTEEKDKAEEKQQNIDEFINKIISYEKGELGNSFDDSVDGDSENTEEKTLNGFLSEVSLVADIDNLNQSARQVMLMTMHSAKGLEFPIVYITGMEDGLFPSYKTIVSENPAELEEERRLCYVGITRAEKELTLCAAKVRMVNGETQMNKVSRFVNEIPKDLINIENQVTGYSKSKISFGGQKTPGEENQFNVRSNAKATLSRYGSGNTSQYASYDKNRVSITGNVRTTTNYGTSRTVTNYGNLRNTGAAKENTKVGFGKEFPMDIFDLSKPATKEVVNGVVKEIAPPSGNQKKDVINENKLGYTIGDYVSSNKFGQGKVISIEEGTRDYMVTVDFEEFGTKRMLAGFAKLEKI